MDGLKIKTLSVGPLATNCYILIEDGRCLVIDPGGDPAAILAEMDSGQIETCAILLTHAHFDHTGGAAALQKETGAPVLVGAADEGLLRDPGWMRQFMSPSGSALRDIKVLWEGQEVTLGKTVLTVWETPGHSPGSLTFAEGPPRSPSAVFSGDLIFRRGIGRTDLPGGDHSLIRKSILRILALPKDTVIYPGHGAPTTVSQERYPGSTEPFN